jgi:hypothetical protein
VQRVQADGAPRHGLQAEEVSPEEHIQRRGCRAERQAGRPGSPAA